MPHELDGIQGHYLKWKKKKNHIRRGYILFHLHIDLKMTKVWR